MAPGVTFTPTYCVGTAIIPPTITTPVGGSTYNWYSDISLSTLVATGSSPTNLQLDFSSASANMKTVYVTETINASNCTSPSTVVILTVDAIPSAPTVTSPVAYCEGETAVALTATGSNLLWYTVLVGGIGNATAPTPSTAVVGTTNYFVSQTVSGCESPRAQIDVIVNATPTAPTVASPVTYCEGATAIALTATGSNLLWYTLSVGGVGSAIASNSLDCSCWYYELFRKPDSKWL
ncbi:MAG: hypothetical protein U5K54_05580 [Cytophagales bacterium]|nr:hypothetical protein [Cytophagales bacterium]